MKFPLSWLKEYVDVQSSANQIAKILTQIGIEVDSVERSELAFTKVIVAKVLAVEKHPSADKLQIAKVFDGTTEHQVVCAAANCRAGIKTAFAGIGATIKEDNGKVFTIKKSKIRDVESFGMLCSAKELQIGEADEGIIEFSEHHLEGRDVAGMYADTIFEVSLTPNLGHCLSVGGIARELAAATNKHYQPPIYALDEGDHDISSSISVLVDDTLGCPRYACRVIKGAKVASSPEWLQKKIAACGFRSINNIVDATNYVLMELGQPLHAFDLQKISGSKVIVRRAKHEEKLTTLDGKDRKLTENDLLICDQAQPIAIAGVMGGLHAEVDEQTTEILIESAYFNPGFIRRTSKKLGLQTDASRRFERRADPNQVIEALDRVTALILEVAGGVCDKGVVDIKQQEFLPKNIECRLSRVNEILGTHLSASEVEQVFQALNFEFTLSVDNVFTVTVPTYRADVLKEIDLIEEVARIYGYDNIVRLSPKYHASDLAPSAMFSFEGVVRKHLLAQGLQEFLTCDLVGPALLEVVQDESLPPEAIIKVLNPTSIEQSILRTSLLPGLLQVIKYNVDHQQAQIHGFEIGHIHFKEQEHYVEQSVLGIIFSGPAELIHWDMKVRPTDFFDLKGCLENLFKGLRVEGIKFKQNKLSTFHPGRQASIMADVLEVGSLGEIHPAIQRRLDISQRIYFAEINLADLLRLCPSENKMIALSIYPASERDWTVTLREEMLVDDVIDLLKGVNSRLLESVGLVGIYRSEKLGSGWKNVTFHFVYRDIKKTIAQETVDREHERILGQVIKKLDTKGEE